MTLQNQIENLNVQVLDMCNIVVTNIEEALKVYQGKKAPFVINDEVVNRYERLIEEMCIDILIRERPYAHDLRQILGVLKLVSDLERIGDHAEDIMYVNNNLLGNNKKRYPEIDKMISKTINMVEKSVASFINLDYELAEKVINEDDIIDNYFASIVKKLTTEKQQTNQEREFAIYNTLVVKYIERIADHAVNISEWVIYIINGVHKGRRI